MNRLVKIKAHSSFDRIENNRGDKFYATNAFANYPKRYSKIMIFINITSGSLECGQALFGS